MLSENAQRLHERMSELSSSTLFTTQELKHLIHVQSDLELLQISQELVNNSLVKLIKQGDELKFQAILTLEANKITKMTSDDAMVYQHIEALGREGIWTKTLKAKTNLHQHIVNKCLKLLESQRYIKLVKLVKHPTRKIYMLYNLQPLTDVTGGPWFTDSELDTEFIDSLLLLIWRYVALRSYPQAFQKPLASTNLFQTLMADLVVPLDDIMSFIRDNRVTNIDLLKSDIRDLCDVLVFDDKLEPVKHEDEKFRATWQLVLEAGFGKQWQDEQYADRVDIQLRDELMGRPYLIFQWYNSEPVGEPEDTVYLDSWVHS